MKRVYFSFPLTFLLVFLCSRAFAQCGNSCPIGSLTTLPAGGVILAGSSYCITSTVNNSSTSYTINGELIVESGATLTIGSVTLNKTGSIVVNGGARLNTSAFTGQSTAPASTIANVTICSGGFLSITGAFNQWETNFVLNDYAILLVDGSWTSSATDVYADIGMGALVELCATLNINTNGFFTETSNSTSYLVVDAEVTESVVNGWISTKENASMIKWTSVGTSAFVSHPAAYTSASVISAAGQTLQRNALPANAGTTRLDLAPSLPVGIYFVRFTGTGLAPLTVRILKTP